MSICKSDVHTCLDIPCMFRHPYIFGHNPYLWMSLITLDAPIHLGGSQTYGEHPSIQRVIQTCGGIEQYRGVSKHRSTQTYRGHPNIWGSADIWGCPNIGACKHMGHPYRGPSKSIGHSNIQGMHPSIWRHPNVWGHVEPP